MSCHLSISQSFDAPNYSQTRAEVAPVPLRRHPVTRTLSHAVDCVEKHALLLAAAPAILSYDPVCGNLFEKALFGISPFTGNLLGAVAYSILGCSEALGAWRSSRCLRDSIARLYSASLLPLASKTQFRATLSTLSERLRLSPQTRKVYAIFKKTFAQPPSSPEEWRELEGAVLYTELCRLEDQYLRISPEEEQLFNATAHHRCYLQSEVEACKAQLKEAALKKKQEQLVLCVGEKAAEVFHKTLPLLRKRLEKKPGKTRTIQRTERLLNTMVQQTQKMCFIHCIGFLAALLVISSFLIVILTCWNPLIAILIGVAGTLTGQGSYLLSCELLDNKGWKFNFKNACKKGYVSIPLQFITEKKQALAKKIEQVVDWWRSLSWSSCWMRDETLLPLYLYKG